MLISEFVHHYGQLDVLVNNAGISIFHEIDSVAFEHWTHAWEETFKTNLFAAANLSFWGAKAMMQTGGGRIVNVSSRGAFRGEPTKPAYGSSKAALNAMSQSLAKKLAPHNIYVGVVAPGFTETEMAAETLTPREKENLLRESPFQRMAQPEEAKKGAFLRVFADIRAPALTTAKQVPRHHLVERLAHRSVADTELLGKGQLAGQGITRFPETLNQALGEQILYLPIQRLEIFTQRHGLQP